jgi:hypothetical protein
MIPLNRKASSLLLLAAALTRLLSFYACTLLATQRDSLHTGIMDAEDTNIQYVGRFDFSNPKKVIFD